MVMDVGVPTNRGCSCTIQLAFLYPLQTPIMELMLYSTITGGAPLHVHVQACLRQTCRCGEGCDAWLAPRLTDVRQMMASEFPDCSSNQ